jgi:predicted transcriptional regulator
MALEKMDELGLSQIPVIEEGKCVGSLRENRVLAKVVRDRELLNTSVREVMEASFPTVDVDASSSEVTRRLQSSPAVLVEEYGRIIGIITRHDVLDLKLNNVAQ